MGVALGEALRKLCDEIGWSYAVFWKAIGAADPVHLVWEDGYCARTAVSEVSEARRSEQFVDQKPSNELLNEAGSESEGGISVLVKKIMASQVHVVGEGIVGQAAFTGNHRWIVPGTTFNEHGFASKVAAEMNHQFRAGIQTIAVIPVLPRGVLQLGSTCVVMENMNLVHHAKRLCSQLNNRSSAVIPGSVKSDINQQDQSHILVGVPGVRAADVYSKVFSGFPITYEQYNRPDTTAMLSSTSLNADMNMSLRKITPPNVQAVREHNLYSKPDVRLTQQAPNYDRRPGSHIQTSVMNSDFTSSSLVSVEKQPLLMATVGLLQSPNSKESAVDVARAVLPKSHGCQNSVGHETVNIMPTSGIDDVLDSLNSNGSFSLLPGGARVIRANLHNRTTCQVLEQIYNTPGSSLQNRSLIPYKVPQSAETARKVMSSGRHLAEASAAPCSDSDVQVSCSGLNADISRDSGLNSSYHIQHDRKVNEENASIAAASMQNMKNINGCKLPYMPDERTSPLPLGPTTGNDLFDMLGPEFQQLCGNVDSDLVSRDDEKTQILDKDAPEYSIYPGSSPVFGALDDEFSYSGIFSLTDTDQLLDAVISNINPGAKQSSDDSVSCKTSLTDIPSTCYAGSSELKQCESSGVPPVPVKNETAVSSFVKQPCFFERAEEVSLSQNNGIHKSQIRLWIESGQNMKCDSVSASNSKGLDTPNKPNRKRSRPGENPRPRPKDRQLIQDRIKELREIVPNGAKCSIDALLEKTIKHMLFLQSVTKHADKLKDSAESKILGGESGLLWKDYFEGGATWAFEVGSQTMTCPIIVEDLDRPRQMLVEMLCEDRGIFLEIADFIRGLGLTILRGVMEARKSKIWARFTVEANRDVTRMEVFLSLVHLLEPGGESSGVPQNSSNVNMPLNMVHQPIIPATGMSDRLQ